MDTPLPPEVRTLLDRQAILDCIHRYCQGIDRLDRDLALSAYHPDAMDDHGTICAPAAAFVDFTLARHRGGMSRTQHHYVTNHSAEIEGDVAHTVTYFLCSITWTAPAEGQPGTSLHGGRYIDRFEKRDGTWAITDRVCLTEWHGALGDLAPPVAAGEPLTGHAARDKSDLQYRRPLRVKR